MSRFNINYEIPEFKTKNERKEYLDRTYATYCVSFMENIKDKIDFTVNDDGEKISYSIEMPNIKISKQKLKHGEKLPRKEKSFEIKKVK